MATYQIYKLLFDCTKEKNFLATMDEKVAFSNAQKLLGDIIKSNLLIYKKQKDGTYRVLDHTVLRIYNDIYLVEVDNKRKYTYKEKLDKKELEFNPGLLAIIDNRDGVAQIAIQRSNSFNSPDEVRKLLEDALNRAFEDYNLTVEIRAKKKQSEFWNMVDEQRNKFHDRIKRISFEFPNDKGVGPMEYPNEMEEKINFMRQIAKMLHARKAIFNAIPEKDKQLHLEKTDKDIANLVMVCANNGYNINVNFERYGIYRMGQVVNVFWSIEDGIIHDFQYGQTMMGRTDLSVMALEECLNSMRNITSDFDSDEKEFAYPSYKEIIESTEDTNYKKPNDIDNKAKTKLFEDLKTYFISEFRGLGRNFNQLEQTINTLVDNEFNDKEYALIAYKMYSSGKMNSSKPQTFAKWYHIFCEAVGCKYNDGYKPSKLKDGNERIDKLFPLL